MTQDTYFVEQGKRRLLKRAPEYLATAFAMGASAILAAVLLAASYSFKENQFSTGTILLAGIFAATALFDLLVWQMIKRDIFDRGELRPLTRALGAVMIATILTGNIFNAIAGFSLINKRKNLEYNIGVYMVIVEIAMLLVSALNIFKPYVTNSFFVGLGLIAAVGVIHLISLPLMTLLIKGNTADRRVIPLGIVLILTSATGNLFALLLGLILLRKAANRDTEISVGWIDVIRRLFRNQMALLGAFIVVFLMAMSLCGNLTFDYEMAVNNNYPAILHSPSLEFPFGTDDFGRCVFTRIIFGARISLLVGIGSSVISIIVGIVLGSFAGYYSNRVDNIIMRVLDVFMAIPGLLLPIAIITAFGTGTVNIIIALGVGAIPGYARTIRASVLTLSGNEFVEAAKACGAKNDTIIFRHIIPNSLAPIIVRATLGIGAGVLAVSSLSYLGLGIAPHIPEWGNILRAGSTYLEQSPHLAIYPGLAIIALVLSFNFLGDGLRDALDPKLK